MDQKYGKTPKQILDEALNQVIPNFPDVLPQSGNAKEISNDELRFFMRKAIVDGWQENIAKCFCDAVDDYCTERQLPNTAHDKEIVLHIANTAAKNFLDSLCNQKNL